MEFSTQRSINSCLHYTTTFSFQTFFLSLFFVKSTLGDLDGSCHQFSMLLLLLAHFIAFLYASKPRNGSVTPLQSQVDGVGEWYLAVAR